ncbi:uncharacterized protein EI90DRAFT_3073990 [Cantharellus anzutake]|uniref:uncharacterized protein n=1 Tax=Cantharellus anzutake TaxID=1750568 RepID=UPI001907620A|nr:uncharacterized protein EI90DRAFT_3073990 [Cantharellus anzutake]KAF8324987.1 hypothetical protein EI90DRAFT_3073990 [Cantharellus anzutake]
MGIKVLLGTIIKVQATYYSVACIPLCILEFSMLKFVNMKLVTHDNNILSSLFFLLISIDSAFALITDIQVPTNILRPCTPATSSP